MQPQTGTAENSLLTIALSGEAALALCALDTATGALTLLGKTGLPGVEGSCGGMPLAASADGSRIYAAWRGDDFRLFSFALDRTARRLTYLGDASLPASMCYAMVSSCGRRVLTSSYTDSTIAISPIGPDRRAGEPIMTREAKHAHCLVEAPNGLVYATSLRGDFVQAYRFDADRSDLIPLARLDMPEGSGPRHIVFTADGSRSYLLSEFAGTLTRLDVDGQTGALTPRQSIALLPDGAKAWAAELRLGPKGDTIYASERNTSQIFCARLGPAGEMQLTGAAPAPECPRAFGFDASGRYLIALGEKGGNAWTCRITKDGTLETLAKSQVGAAPSWVLATAL